MKISEMTNDQAADTLIRIAEPFGNLCEDEALMEMINTFQESQDTPFVQTLGKMIPKLVGYLLKSHKADLYGIVGALTFKSKSEVAKMNFIQTISIVRESYDEVLESFLSFSGKQTEKPATV